MVSLNDIYGQLTLANSNLQQIHSDDVNLITVTESVKTSVDTVNTSVNQVNNTLNAGFVNISQGIQNIITLQDYTNQALFHLSEQNDTIICILENISKQTCELLSEAHIQTGLQKSIKESIATLLELYKSTHPDASLELERLENLHKQILECCPPEEPRPFCNYESCPTPTQLNQPPQPNYQVFTLPQNE